MNETVVISKNEYLEYQSQQEEIIKLREEIMVLKEMVQKL
jgi:hypothetical protein